MSGITMEELSPSTRTKITTIEDVATKASNDITTVAESVSDLGIKVASVVNTDGTPKTASSTTPGLVKPDGTSISVDTNGVLSANVEEVIKSFVVNSGKSVTAGDVVAFVNGGIETAPGKLLELKDMGKVDIFTTQTITTDIRSYALDTNTILVVWKIYNGATMGCVGIINNNSIVFGTAAILNGNVLSDYDICVMNTSRVIFSYLNGTTPVSIILSISDMGITVPQGTSLIDSGNTYQLRLLKLTDSSVLCVRHHYNGNYYISSSILDVNGSSLSKIGIESSSTAGEIPSQLLSMQVYKINSTTFLLSYVLDQYYGYVRIVNISGSTISYGIKTALLDSTNTPIFASCIEKIDDNNIVILFKKSLITFITTIKISGTTITTGTISSIYNTGNRTACSIKIVNNKYGFIMYNSNKNLFLKSIFFDGANISYGNEYLLCINEQDGDPGTGLSIQVLNNNVFLFNSIYVGNSTNCIVNVFIKSITLENVLGIAKESTSSGSNCKVSLGPVTNGLTGLTQGTTYYTDINGKLTTNRGICRIGTAISTASIKQNIQTYNTY